MNPIRIAALRVAILAVLGAPAACVGSTPAEPASTVQITLGGTDLRTDPARIVGAVVQANLLRVEVQYGGGCAEHRFQLHMTGAFLESDPVQARLQLSHDAGGDPCRAMIGETLEFDLSPLRRSFEHAYPGARVLLLQLQEPGAATPVQPPIRFEL